MSTSRSRVPVAAGLPAWHNPAAGWTPPGNTQGPAGAHRDASQPAAAAPEDRVIPLAAEFDGSTGALVALTAGGAQVMVIGSAAPDDNDGRPDGTLYVQVSA